MRALGRPAAAVAWVAVGALGGVGVAAILSIGIFLLAAAGLLAGVLLVTNAPGARWAGLGVGAGFVALGVISLPWQSCSGDATLTVTGPGGSASSECGGIHPAVWFALGLGAAVGPVVLGAPEPPSRPFGDGPPWEGAPERPPRESSAGGPPREGAP